MKTTTTTTLQVLQANLFASNRSHSLSFTSPVVPQRFSRIPTGRRTDKGWREIISSQPVNNNVTKYCRTFLHHRWPLCNSADGWMSKTTVDYLLSFASQWSSVRKKMFHVETFSVEKLIDVFMSENVIMLIHSLNLHLIHSKRLCNRLRLIFWVASSILNVMNFSMEPKIPLGKNYKIFYPVHQNHSKPFSSNGLAYWTVIK